MTRNVGRKQSIPPTLPPAEAIRLLRRQVDRIDELKNKKHQDPAIGAWESTTINALNAAFGMPDGEMHENTLEFKRATSGVPVRAVGYGNVPNPAESQTRHLLKLDRRRALLEAFVEQLQDLAPPIAAMPPYPYFFHPEIERVSGALFHDGHYKQSALEAYVRVINAVREISGIDQDGDRLMNNAFGFENQVPAIQVNRLQSDSEKDEQRGFMFLYKGIVGLRNAKAHSNTLFDDPRRAHEYLALSSLLMRILEISKVNRNP